MQQMDLYGKALPPPPEPSMEPNVFYYGETITEVEEFYDEHGLPCERATAKEIVAREFYCEYAEFNSQGYCYGCDTSEHDKSYCMDLARVKQSSRTINSKSRRMEVDESGA